MTKLFYDVCNIAFVYFYLLLCTLVIVYRSLLINIPTVSAMTSMSFITGVITVAYYAQNECDPLESGQVSKANQVSHLLLIRLRYTIYI